MTIMGLLSITDPTIATPSVKLFLKVSPALRNAPIFGTSTLDIANFVSESINS